MTVLLIPPRRARVDLPGLTMADAREGLVVTSIKRDSAADHAGLRVGDLIVELDGQPVSSRATAIAVLHDESSQVIDLEVAHNHSIRHMILKQGGD